MGAPFRILLTKQTTFVRRLLRRPSIDSAIADINNMLAGRALREVTATHIEHVLDTHHLRPLRTEHRQRLERFYRDYLLFCLTDRRLSDDEVADLDHLRSILGLSTSTVDVIHRTVARQVYLRSVAEVLADGTIDEREREFLHKLRDHLAIPEAIAENIEEMKERQRKSRR